MLKLVNRFKLTLFTYCIAVNLITVNPILLITNTRASSLRKNRSLNNHNQYFPILSRHQHHTLTAMMYVIAANVVAPARSSFKNVEPTISFG
jgi:hypothetical protein